MLDAYIIEEIKRRERERQRQERERPQLEVPESDGEESRRSDRDERPAPGVVQVDLHPT